MGHRTPERQSSAKQGEPDAEQTLVGLENAEIESSETGICFSFRECVRRENHAEIYSVAALHDNGEAMGPLYARAYSFGNLEAIVKQSRWRNYNRNLKRLRRNGIVIEVLKHQSWKIIIARAPGPSGFLDNADNIEIDLEAGGSRGDGSPIHELPYTEAHDHQSSPRISTAASLPRSTHRTESHKTKQRERRKATRLAMRELQASQEDSEKESAGQLKIWTDDDELMAKSLFFAFCSDAEIAVDELSSERRNAIRLFKRVKSLSFRMTGQLEEYIGLKIEEIVAVRRLLSKIPRRLDEIRRIHDGLVFSEANEKTRARSTLNLLRLDRLHAHLPNILRGMQTSQRALGKRLVSARAAEEKMIELTSQKERSERVWWRSKAEMDWLETFMPGSPVYERLRSSVLCEELAGSQNRGCFLSEGNCKLTEVGNRLAYILFNVRL